MCWPCWPAEYHKRTPRINWCVQTRLWMLCVVLWWHLQPADVRRYHHEDGWCYFNQWACVKGWGGDREWQGCWRLLQLGAQAEKTTEPTTDCILLPQHTLTRNAQNTQAVSRRPGTMIKITVASSVFRVAGAITTYLLLTGTCRDRQKTIISPSSQEASSRIIVPNEHFEAVKQTEDLGWLTNPHVSNSRLMMFNVARAEKFWVSKTHYWPLYHCSR